MHARVPLSAHAFLALLTAAVLTGCSVAGGTAEASGAEPSPMAVTTRAKALSQAELRAPALRAAELPEALPDGIPVQDRSDPADRSSFKPASDPDCQKVHDIRYAATASAVVDQVIKSSMGRAASTAAGSPLPPTTTVRPSGSSTPPLRRRP